MGEELNNYWPPPTVFACSIDLFPMLGNHGASSLPTHLHRCLKACIAQKKQLQSCKFPQKYTIWKCGKLLSVLLYMRDIYLYIGTKNWSWLNTKTHLQLLANKQQLETTRNQQQKTVSTHHGNIYIYNHYHPCMVYVLPPCGRCCLV